MRISPFFTLIAVIGVASVGRAADDFISLFNGKDLTGWKIPNPPSGNFKGVKEVKNDVRLKSTTG